MRRAAGILLAIVLPMGCLAAPDETTGAALLPPTALFHSEKALPEALEQQYLPHLRDQGILEYRTDDGLRLRYTVTRGSGEDASVVIVNGRAESFVLAAELLDDLRSLPFTFYSYDHRGQGLSEHPLYDKGKGHIDDFATYARDLATFLDQVVAPMDARPVILVGHSMGAAVATLYALAHPDRVRGLVLSSPMFGLVAPSWTTLDRMRISARTMPATDYAVGQGPFDATAMTFEGNGLTGSRARFEMARQILLEDYPETQLGGVTNGWISAALDVTTLIQGLAPQLRGDTLMLLGAKDTVVSTAVARQVCDRAPRCRAVTVAEAQHQIFIESDLPRAQGLWEVAAFLMMHR